MAFRTREGFIRWSRFSAVGLGGVAIQLGVLWFCTRIAGLSPVLSIIIAVEAALLHNFAWHETWTWRKMPVAGRWGRLMRFHASNGFVSLGSNTVLTMLFAQHLGMPLLVSNLLAISVTTVLNFVVADLWVFRRADNQT